MMKRWLFASVALASLGFACVDLFHKTDFETACAEDGSAPGCTSSSSEASVDAGELRKHLDTCSDSFSPTRLDALTARTCAWLGSCLGPYRETRFGQCMLHARVAYDCKANADQRPVIGSEMDLAWSCLAGADGSGPQSCDQVFKCLYPAEGRAKSVSYDSGGTLTLCDNSGSVAVFDKGGNNFPIATDPCVLHARHCVRNSENSAAYCVPQPDTLVPASQDTSTCVSGKYASVKGAPEEQDRGLDCSYLGVGSCSKTGPICNGTGTEVCNDAGVISCNGTRAVACADGKRVTFDCDRLGMTCSEDAGAFPSIETSCVESTGNGDCDGLTEGTDNCTANTLVACVKGHKFSLDCQTVGLKTCQYDARGSRCNPQ